MTTIDPYADPGPPRHVKDADSLATRRRVLRVLTIAAVTAAMFTSGWGMWTFFADLPRIDAWWHILPMFLLFDLAAVACAWAARINRLTYGRMGVEGWLVWVFAITSGLMSSSDATGRESAIRFAAPMVAAILFELLIRGERRDLTNVDGPLARIRRRTLARLGLLDDVDQDDESAARARMAAKLAALAYRVHQTVEGSRSRRSAVRRYHRRLRTATVRMGFATDDDMVDEVRLHLDALYRSITGTSASAVADLNVWQSAATAWMPDEAPSEVDTASAQVAVPTDPIVVRPRLGATPRSRTHGRLAGRRRYPEAPQTPAPAAPAPVEAPAPGVAALNGHPRPVPEVTAKVTKPKPARPAKPARRSSSAASSTDEERAWQFWRLEISQGRTPSAADIASHIGASRATGGRYLKKFNSRPRGVTA